MVLEIELLLLLLGVRHIPDACGIVPPAARDNPETVWRPLDLLQQLLVLFDLMCQLDPVADWID